jgi:Tol biopolymer transport system component
MPQRRLSDQVAVLYSCHANMPLAPGARLGPYEIVGPIGAGGMGEVYRGRDTKLKRDVALKVLPDSFASDPDRLARFTREAQTLASLNHPNIAHIHGLEESESVTAIVMELVEGDDLSQRIARGAIPLEEALPIAKQIAEALEAAHEQGIIHRDLKPANIKIRPDGTVKVLDFGLAKALDANASGATAGGVEAMNSPTLTARATQMGMILGTAAYMAPEQAKGRTVGRRADVWAFGAVFYEMLTGSRAFPGEDVSDTLAAVLRGEPDWARLPATLSPALGTYIRRCLHKDQRQRIHDIADVRLALEGAFETDPPQTTAPAPTAAPRGRLAWMIALGIAAVVIAALAVPALRHLREAPPFEPPVTRFTIAPPDGATVTSAPMISPDGSRVVFAGGGALFVRPLDALAAQRLPATEGAGFPFWSPDSRSIGFFASGKLKKVDVAGGPAVTICDAPDGRGGAWSPTGVIVFAPTLATGLQQVSAGGGTPAPATILDAATQAISHKWPQFLPDGGHFLFFNVAAAGSTGIYVTSLGSKTSTLLVLTDARAEYAPPGALLFLRGTTLMRQPFDTAGLRLTGSEAPVAEDIALPGSNDAAFSVSHTGVLAYSTGQAAAIRRLVWVDRRGGVTPLALAPGVYDSPALSPDGQHIVLIVRDATGAHLWVYDIARGTLGKRTFDGRDNSLPIWTRDGTFLTFARSGGSLMRVRADGSGTAEPLVADAQLPGTKVATSWSPDSRLLAFQSGQPGDVVVRDAEGKLHPTLTTSAGEREGRFSPDGHWLAYRSNETGRWEVYVQSYPPGHGKWQISTDGGGQGMWAPTGRELFYKSANRMMVVDIELGATFKAGTPRALFEMPLPDRAPDDPDRFGVTPDAQRFLVLTTATGEKGAVSTPPITVVLNYAQALRR